MIHAVRTFRSLPAFALSLALAGAVSAQEWVPVTDGKSAAGLYKHGGGTVVYDPAGIIKVTGGNGYLATNKEYTHFRTRIEWNNTAGGNTGFLYHILTDAVWPLGLECQMASNDVGSLWTTGAKFNSTAVKSGNDYAYSETGSLLTQHGTAGTARNHFIRSQDPVAPVNQWNTWEMFVKGDSLEIKANNKVVMRIGKLTINNGTPLVKGKIGLQIEGAAVQWRNWVIQDLAQTTGLPGGKNLLESDREGRLRIGPGPGMAMAFSVGLPSEAATGAGEAGRAFAIDGRLKAIPLARQP